MPTATTAGHVLLDRSGVRLDRSERRPALAPEMWVRVRAMSLAWTIAGPLAEAIAFGAADGGSRNDYREAATATDRMDDEADVRHWMWRPVCKRDVEGYLKRHWPRLAVLANTLLLERTMNGARVACVLGEVSPLDLQNIEAAVRHWQGRIAARERARSRGLA